MAGSEHGPSFLFWYRESPALLLADSTTGRVHAHRPPHEVPGMIQLMLTAGGRLVLLRAVPPARVPTGRACAEETGEQGILVGAESVPVLDHIDVVRAEGGEAGQLPRQFVVQALRAKWSQRRASAQVRKGCNTWFTYTHGEGGDDTLARRDRATIPADQRAFRRYGHSEIGNSGNGHSGEGGYGRR